MRPDETARHGLKRASLGKGRRMMETATREVLEWALAAPGVFFHGTPKLGDYSTITRPLYLTQRLDRAVEYAGYRARGFVLVLRVDPERLVHREGCDPCLPAGSREGEDFSLVAILPGREVWHYLGWEIPWYWKLGG